MKDNILSKTLFLFVLLLPAAAVAQSVDSCLQAKGTDAIDTCRQTLDSGSRNQNVFLKLATELFQQGRLDESLIVVREGLGIYPSNVNLTRLRDYIEVDQTEEQQLQASAKKNNAVIKLGKLKITCRTKSTREGLNACREYLSSTNVDKQLILDRVAVLEDKLRLREPQTTPDIKVATNDKPVAVEQTPRPRPEPKPEPKPERIPKPQPTPISEPQLTDSESAAISEAENALRVLVFDVQTNLKRLGFETGTPDGIPGTRTRSALSSFYRTNPVPDNEFSENGFISESTLRDLITANNDKQIAEKMLAESQLAARSGNAARALLILNQAEQNSVFVTIPPGYKEDLTRQVKVLALKQTETQTNTQSPGTQETGNDAGQRNQPTTTTTASRDISGLLNQINRLESKLKQQEQNLAESLQLIDGAAANIRF